ncbi:MAG: phosphatase PAP2 family protein [Candidatus Lokiarchaeota archaeon]|nr:phosphatase PAP2 family protein [Candidatus Lokiarchaeota archaeon]
MRLKPFQLSILLGAAFTLAMTLVFYFTSLDLDIARLFYDESGPVRFPVGETMPWIWFYENDTLLIILLAVIALFFIIIGASVKRLRPFLVYGLFMIVSYLIGPGLIANVLFKGTEIGDFYIGWGRPRPREITEFGGSADFFRVWEPAFMFGYHDDNSSFPSGHVTAGSIFIVIYFVFNNVEFIARIFGEKTRAKVAAVNLIKYAGLVAAVVLGILLAITRISAGGHFASDCMYSFVFTWLPTAVLYYWVFRIPRLEQRALDRMQDAATATSV